jgi:NAD(P)-dependent dehydrogenase (short-subunit alcohol dehydrogenase family)
MTGARAREHLRESPIVASAPATPRHRVAIVTGDAGTVAHRIVTALAADGCLLVLGYLHEQARADALVEGVLAAGGSAVAVRGDPTDELDAERHFAEAAAAFGGVDALIHVDDGGDLAVVSRVAAGELRSRGAVVHVSPFAAALEALVPVLAGELGERAITVNGIAYRAPAAEEEAGEIARTAAFLACERGRHVSGQVIRVGRP